MKKLIFKIAGTAFCMLAIFASSASLVLAQDEVPSTDLVESSCKWSSAISSGSNNRFDCIATGTGGTCKCGATMTEPK